MPYDSTSFTSKKDKKENFLQKHFGKILVGASVLVAGIFLSRGKLWDKPISFEKVQQNFAEIFGKTFTKEETEKLIQKYKEIYNIKDKNEFIKQAFNQVKKDFGYENLPIKLDITNDTKVAGDNGLKCISISDKYGKDTTLRTTAHEFQHRRQEEYMFRANPQKCIEITINRLISESTNPKIKELYAKKPESFREMIKEILETRLGKLSKFKKGSPEYAIAEQYFEGKANYKDGLEDYKAYINNFLEQDANRVGNLMKEVAKYIKYN